METLDRDLKNLCLELFEIGALKFGDYKMKVGINSPVYFDMRVMVSYPFLMDKLGDIVWAFCKHWNIQTSSICGVPYTALPVATLVSVKSNLPMLIRRKEAKKYGTMKLIEGKFSPGENCLIIEDVVTSGCSILETVTDLKNNGLTVTDAIVIVDREQGGKINLTNQGIKMHSLLTLSKVMDILFENGKVNKSTVDTVNKYVNENQIFPNGVPMTVNGSQVGGRLSMSFAERALVTECKAAKRLFKIMEEKKTNLCAALDVTDSSELLRLADLIGPSVCIVKTHFDAVLDWNFQTESSLKELSKKHNFIVMEDRKFGDIGNTVQKQCAKIFKWAELVTLHTIGGPGSLEGAKEAAVKINDMEESPGVFLVAELSSKGNLISTEYTKSTVELGKTFKNLVIGFVCQNLSTFSDPGFIQLTPGVSTASGADSLGQQYVTPEDAILIKGGDVIVVGRAISQSSDPKGVSQELKEKLWSAYQKRISLG